MRKIKELLCLKWQMGLTNRQIARSCTISHSTVSDVLRRASDAGLTWPLPEELDDAALESMLYTQPKQPPSETRPKPDMEWIHRELRRKSVTLQLLWQEYKDKYPEGYQYSQFCDLYRRWCETLDVSMRQPHRAGEKLFVDYAGQTVPVVERSTGEVRQAQIFVAVMGASSYTYADASWSQELASWISSHCKAFSFFRGVPEILVPDNLAAGVTRSCRYEPDINPTYQEMARHYGVAVIPARPRKPKDKSKVENGVLQVNRWILARLRNRTFFNLSELNQAITETLEILNHKPFQKIEGSRYSLFESLDRPALKPLPAEPYEFAQWKKARVNIDHHVEVDSNYYSVPYQLIKQQVDIRLTATAVEVLYKGKRIASHPRCQGKGNYKTTPEHRPPAHRKYLEWTPNRIISWAKSIGPNTAQMAQSIMNSRPVPEQGYRSCMGLIRLSKRYTPERLEVACIRALKLGAYSYKSVESILVKGLDNLTLEERSNIPLRHHENLRGASYYGQRGVDKC